MLDAGAKTQSKGRKTESKLAEADEDNQATSKERGLKAHKAIAKRVSFKTDNTIGSDRFSSIQAEEPARISAVQASASDAGKGERSPQRRGSGQFNITRTSRAGQSFARVQSTTLVNQPNFNPSLPVDDEVEDPAKVEARDVRAAHLKATLISQKTLGTNDSQVGLVPDDPTPIHPKRTLTRTQHTNIAQTMTSTSPGAGHATTNVTINFNSNPMQPNPALQQQHVVPLADYNYECRQSTYWMTKAEHFRKECQAWKQARNQAWQETSQLQNLLKDKQRRIQELERVIHDFELTSPGNFSPPDSSALTISSNMSVSQTPRIGSGAQRNSAALLQSQKFSKMSKYLYEDIQSVDNPSGIQDGSAGTDSFYSPYQNSEEYKQRVMHQQMVDMNRTSNYKLVPPLDLKNASASPPKGRYNPASLASPERRFSINPLPLYGPPSQHPGKPWAR